jgi:hypothetical protein
VNQELKVILTLVNNTKEAVKGFQNDLGAIKNSVAQLAGLDTVVGKLDNISGSMKELLTHGKSVADSNKKIEERSLSLAEGLHKAGEAIRFLTGGFLAYEGVRILKEFADTAARGEELSIALSAVAQNAGVSTEEINKTQHALTEMGISSDSAKRSMTLLIRSGVGVGFAQPLAQAAKDLAAVSGADPSSTLQSISRAIETLNGRRLKQFGLLIDQARLFKQAELEFNTTLSDTERRVVLTGEVLLQASKNAGAWEQGLNSAGIQLRRMPTLIEDFKEELGKGLLPVYTEIVRGINQVIEASTEFIRGTHQEGEEVNVFGQKIAKVSPAIRLLADGVKAFFSAIASGINFLSQFKTLLEVIAVLIGTRLAFGTFAALVAKVGATSLGKATLEFLALSKGIKSIADAGAFASLGLELFGAGLLRLVGGPIGALIALIAALGFAIDHYEESARKAGAAGAGAGGIKDRLLESIPVIGVAIAAYRTLLGVYAEYVNKGKGVVNSNTEVSESTKKLIEASKAVIDTTDLLMQKENEANKLRQRLKIGDQNLSEDEKRQLEEQLGAAEKEIDRLTKNQKALIAKRDVAQDHANQEPANAASQKAFEDFQKNINSAITARLSLEEHLKKEQAAAAQVGIAYGERKDAAGRTIGLEIKGTQDVIQKTIELKTALQALAHVSGDVGAAFELSMEQVVGSIRSAKTKIDLQIVKDQAISEFAKQSQARLASGDTGNLTPEQFAAQLKSNLERLAKIETDQTITVEAEEKVRKKHGDDAKFARDKAVAEASAQIAKAGGETEIKNRQEQLRQLEDLDQSFYERGRITVDKFYTDKADFIHRDFELQKQTLQLQLVEASKSPTNETPEQNLQRTAKLKAIQVQIDQLAAKEATAQQKNQLDLTKEREDQERRLRDIDQQRLSIQDSYAGELQQIENQRLDELRTNRALADTEEARATATRINAEFDAKRQQSTTRFLQERADIENQTLALFNADEAALQKIQLDLQQQLTRLGSNLSEDSKITAEKLKQKAAIESQLKALDLAIARTKVLTDLARSQADAFTSAADLLESKGKLSPLEAEGQRNLAILKQVEAAQQDIVALQQKRLGLEQLLLQAQVGGNADEIDGVRRQIAGVDTEINKNIVTVNNLKKSYHDLADTIRDSFTNAFEGLFEGLMNRSKSFFQSLKDFGKSVASDINKVVAKELAQKATSALSSATQGLPGGDLFGFLAKAIGGGNERGTETNPMVVKWSTADQAMKNITKGLFGGGSGAGGILGPDGTSGDDLTSLFGGSSESGGGFFDSFKSAISGLGETLKDAFSGMGSLFASIFSGGGSGGGLFSTLAGFFADGGMISGPGTGKSDSIPAMVSNGEFVVNAEATRRWLPILSAINGGAGLSALAPRLPKYATGGLVNVSPSAASGINGTPMHVTVIQHIQTPDVQSFRKSRDQLALEAQASMRRAARKYS